MRRCLQTIQQPIRPRRVILNGWRNSGIVQRCAPLNARAYSTALEAEPQFGQPVYETHPHLLKPGEVTPGISALEYAQRRTKLASKLPKNGIAVLAAADVKYRSGAVFYEFHQDSNFFYLTGFNEPEALAIIGKSEDEKDHTFHLYVRAKDRKAEQWEGARSGFEAATEVFNADETGDIKQLSTILPPIVSSASSVYTDIPLKSPPTTFLSRFLPSSNTKDEGLASLLPSSKIHWLKPLINDFRAIKSEAEIANMRKAGQASGRAFTNAMRQSWTREKDLQNKLEYDFKLNGCDGSAYVPVVAGGKHALSIHYTRNDDILRPGELVLVDAGGEYGNYITDITRTFPISPHFTAPQRDLYTALLTVQRHCISLLSTSSHTTLDALHQIAESHLSANLSALGFDISRNAIEELFPHHLSHYVGLDVHDTPGYGRGRTLEEGMCVTVEPGVYVPVGDERWPRAFWGMGFRVEDCVVVGKTGPYVLTTEAVKEVDDIEALRS